VSLVELFENNSDKDIMKFFKKSVCLLFFFWIANNLFAQQVTLQGIVLNEESIPMDFMHVNLLNKEDEIIGTMWTDSLGQFSIIAEKGDYILQLKQFGQEVLKRDIYLNENINLGILEINDAILLDDVTVTYNKQIFERKTDRLIFNVENAISVTGGDAFDVLKNTPGLRIQDETISMIGKSTISIMVNERLLRLSGQDLINYLKTIESSDVKSIEVLSNPPAKYSAEGNSGLVNIVTKKNKINYIGGTLRSSIHTSSRTTGIVGGSFAYQKEKISLFTNATYNKGSFDVTENTKVYYPSQLWESNSLIRTFSNLLSIRVGGDYNISDNSVIGIQYIMSNNKPDSEENTNTYIYNTYQNSLDSIIKTHSDADADQNTHSLNAHYKIDLDSLGKKINLDVDFLKYNKDLTGINKSNNYTADNELQNDDTYIFKPISIQSIKAFTTTLDVELPIPILDISFGGKMSLLQNNSESMTYDYSNEKYVERESDTDNFLYKENTYATYINLNKSIAKWNFQLGARLESTNTKGNSKSLDQINKNNYTKIFPTVYVVYNHNDKNSYSLNYGKRISKPGYFKLNPFKWYSNPYSYVEGNPFLKPSFSDNIEFNHTFNGNLNSSIYFSKTSGGTDQITLVDPNTNIQATVWDNFIKEYSVGITESYQFNQFKWLNSYLQANLYYTKTKSTNSNTIDFKEGVNFFFLINNSIFFNDKKTIMGEINYWYEAPGVTTVYDISGSSSLDVGFRVSCFSKKMDMSISVSDIFKTNISTISGLSNNINIEYRNYYDSRKFRVSIVYHFGNTKIRSGQSKSSNEEEKNRLN